MMLHQVTMFHVMESEIDIDENSSKILINIVMCMKDELYLHKFTISSGIIAGNFWSMINFVKNNLTGKFKIVDLLCTRRKCDCGYRLKSHLCKSKAGKVAMNNELLEFNEQSTMQYKQYYSNFGETMNNAVKAFTKKLITKYLTLLMIGIVQRLDKNNIPREITNIIFQFCNVNVDLSANRKFTLNGRELLMIK